MTASKGNGMRVKSIGHYTLSKTIGEGTFGKVKLGTHILTGEKVAVKILEKERIADVADVERVAREIKILKLVQHPHVIQLYEIIETPKQLYLIMEFCCGGELFDYIVSQGRVQEHEACRFFHQILAGVEQIHRMNVVHRDLKPENLLFDDEQNIKIVDFGLSNTFEDGQLLKTACGSPCYAAPEMIAGHRYVPARCDVWSCGVILFALVCGYLPFEDQNTSALYRKILDADYQAPKFISDSVRDLITRMLTTDPELRITVPRIRNHSWYQQIPEASRRWTGANEERDLDNEVLEHLECLDFQRNYAVKCLQMGKHNHLTTTYHLLREKKRRMGGYLEDPHRQFDESDSGYVGQVDAAGGAAGGGGGGKYGHDTLPGVPAAPAADADRAAGSGPAEMDAALRSPRHSRGSESSQPPYSARPHYSAAVEALGMPPGQFAHAITASRGSAGEAPASARDWRPRSSTSSTSDPLAEVQAHRLPYGAAPAAAAAAASPAGGDGSRRGPAHAAVPLPSRVAGAAARRHGESQSTPRGGTSPVQATPWRRSPFQQSTGIAAPITPRGATSQSPTPRLPVSARADLPSAYAVPLAAPPRSRTPGKRVAGEPLSARESIGRPGSSQATAAPARPMVPASARNQPCEVRRRHYTAANSLDAAPLSTSGPRTAAAAVAADLYGEELPGGITSRSVAAPRMSAWPSRPQGTIRASSASPELVSDTGGGLSSREPAGGAEAMRTCRGAFNVSCTTSKAPKQIMQEMHRALALLRIVFKQTSPFLLKCQKQSLRFEMEVSHLDHLESIYVVRFRRVAGDMAAYKELCAKILADMKI